MTESQKVTPRDVSDFEREQLRFFLGESDLTTMLAEVNPSLAWLPILSELKLLKSSTDLTLWIEKNFAEIDAVKEVAENIRSFDRETAELLDLRLNQAKNIPPLAVACWRLIIRHLQNTRDDALQSDWYEITPRIRNGERSGEIIERFANMLQPRLRVGPRSAWLFQSSSSQAPEHPTDVIAIEYEIPDDIVNDEVLTLWPDDIAADIDARLLQQLTEALRRALEDAIDAGVESNAYFSRSDVDIPSIDKEYPSYRLGFSAIVTVIAHIWKRLAQKDTGQAIKFVALWTDSNLRLVRRLATFAAADQLVSPEMAANILVSLPITELYLANSCIEVYRLIDARWGEFTPDQRQAIEGRIISGPPEDLFATDRERIVDSCRFELFWHIKSTGTELGCAAQSVLEDISSRWPAWRYAPASAEADSHPPTPLVNVAQDLSIFENLDDAQLIDTALVHESGSGLPSGFRWNSLCQDNPPKALRALAAKNEASPWPVWAWRSFLWVAPKLGESDDVQQTARLVLAAPLHDFTEIRHEISWWLSEDGIRLDDGLFWQLWDRLVEVSAADMNEDNTVLEKAEAARETSYRLADALIRRLHLHSDEDMPDPVRVRLDGLVVSKGSFGYHARRRLAAGVSYLFSKAPDWTTKNIIPLFDWSSPEAPSAWSARKYSTYIGSPELIELTKRPFLELFDRDDTNEEDLRTYAGWLTIMMIASQSKKANYPITAIEARAALRHAGARVLPIVGHRLATEMKAAAPDKHATVWQEIVGPVFRSIWPLDVELQTSASTLHLVQLLCATGNAFGVAYEAIIPFIAGEKPQGYTSIFTISNADDVLYSLFPDKMLNLVEATVGEHSATKIWALENVLERIRGHAPDLANSRQYQRLLARK